MRQDHFVAETQARSAWQREKAAFERRHRAKLRTYVETRLALAQENARLNYIRAEELARANSASRSTLASRTRGSAGALMETAVSAAGVWVTRSGTVAGTRQRPPGSAQRLAERAKHILREVPQRTRQVLSGNDELVANTMAGGMSRGLAIFLALLMLHIPSLAVASLAAGVFLMRGHRSASGAFFLGLAAILGLIIFFVLPW